MREDIKGFVIHNGETHTFTKTSPLAAFLRNNNSQEEGVDGWSQSITAYRCIDMRASSLANLPREIVDTETGKVISQANFPQPEADEYGRPYDDEESLPIDIDLSELLWLTEVAMCILSRATMHILKNSIVVKGVEWLDPRSTTPKYGDYGIEYFEKKQKRGGNIPIPVDDVIYVRRPGLGDQDLAPSPLQVASTDAGIEFNQAAFLNQFFKGGAMPTTIVTAEDQPPPAERKRIEKFMSRMLSGIRNAWGFKVLSSGLKFHHLTPPLKDMMLDEVSRRSAEKICIAMGVSLSLVFSEAATHATAEVDDTNFYTKTLIPEASLIARQMNKHLWWRLGYRMRFRPDKLEIFQRQELAKLQYIDKIARVLTDGELRAAGGYSSSKPQELDTDVVSAPQPDEPKTESQATPSTEGDELEIKAHTPLLTDSPYIKASVVAWQDKVIRAWPQTRPEDVKFSSPTMPIWLKEAIIRDLASCHSVEEVKAAFAAPFFREGNTAVYRTNGR